MAVSAAGGCRVCGLHVAHGGTARQLEAVVAIVASWCAFWGQRGGLCLRTCGMRLVCLERRLARAEGHEAITSAVREWMRRMPVGDHLRSLCAR